MREFDTENGIVFENHPSSISDVTDEVVDQQAIRLPPSTPGQGPLDSSSSDRIRSGSTDTTTENEEPFLFAMLMDGVERR